MRIYVRGDRLAPEIQSTLSGAGLKKYWLVDEAGNPVGKPFARRGEVELYEATIEGGEYEIISGSRGRPRLYDSEQERKAAHDRKRNQERDRRQYKADWIREKRSTS